jgi:hypothetical protein
MVTDEFPVIRPQQIWSIQAGRHEVVRRSERHSCAVEDPDPRNARSPERAHRPRVFHRTGGGSSATRPDLCEVARGSLEEHDERSHLAATTGRVGQTRLGRDSGMIDL